MSKLEELIKEFCPNGVEYKALENCCNILDKQRKPISKGARINGEYPYYGANGIQDYISDYIFDGTFVLVGEDGSVVTEKGTPIVNWAVGKIWVNNHAHIISESEGVLLRYLYHFLQVVDITQLVHGNIPKLTQGDFKMLQIPVPPMEVQCEIVRILDNFTELTAELTARKKQYEYYRDQLLTFDENDTSVEWKAFGDIGTVERGNGLSKSDFTEIGYPCIHYGQIYTYYGTFATSTKSFISEKLAKTLKTVSKGNLIIAVTSENLEDVCKCVAWLGEDDIVTGGHTAIFKHNQNPKFIAYWLQTKEFFTQKVKLAQGTKVIEVSPKKLEKVRIPLPPLEEQERIVSILDRFDKLCTDISVGLPAEIEARKKQYEYYRDKLLTFEPIQSTEKKFT